MDISTLVVCCCLAGQLPLGQGQTSGQEGVPPVQPAAPATLDPLGRLEVRPPAPATMPPIPPSTYGDPEAPAAAGPLAPTAPRVEQAAAAAATSLPRDLLSDALLLPAGADVKGQPLTLLEALAPAAWRPQQSAVTTAYWELCAAVAEFRYAWDIDHRLKELIALMQTREASGSLAHCELQIRCTAAQARLHQARIRLATAQYELASHRGTSVTDETLPLPLDLPHTGAYETRFRQVYATRTPPPEARLIDRLLPMQRELVVQRAAAVQAASDAWSAAADAYQRGQAALPILVRCLDDLDRQRQAFIAAVLDYNQHIARYALTAAPSGMDRQAVVGMLIRPSAADTRRARTNTLPGTGAGARPATYLEPIRDGDPRPPSEQDVPASAQGLPAAAGRTGDPASPLHLPAGSGADVATPPAGVVPPAAFESPADARPLLGAPQTLPSGAGGDPSGPKPSGLSLPPDPFIRTRPQIAPDGASVAPGAVPSGPALQPPPSAAPLVAVVRRAVWDQASTAVLVEKPAPPRPLYPSLAEMPPARRAQQLVALLYTNPARKVPTVSLADALRTAPIDHRRTVIEQYWQACHWMAAHEAAASHRDQLQALAPAVLRMRDQAGGAEAMLRLESARLNAQAAVTEALVRRTAAELKLASSLRASGDGPAVVPTTRPHAGGYLLKFEAQPPAIYQSLNLRRLAATIPLWQAAVQQQAGAVLAADGGRVAALEAHDAGSATADEAIDALKRQAAATSEFLAAVERYNLAIADYVLGLLPSSIAADTLAGALVVAR